MKSDRKDKVVRQLANLQKEKLAHDWWRFQYANRHFKTAFMFSDHILKSIDVSFRWLTDFYNSYRSAEMKPIARGDEDLGEFFKFANCLVYEYHKKYINDGFADLRFEALSWELGYPLSKLKPEDIDFVEYLHRLTIHFGFLVVPLDTKPDCSLSIEMFVDKNASLNLGTTFVQLYPYPKKSDFPEGIRIVTRHDRNPVSENWDMAVYWRDGDTFSHIKEEVDAKWKVDNKQVVGIPINYDIAFFINRKDGVTKTRVKDVLRLQIMWTLVNDITRTITMLDEKQNKVFTDVKPRKELRRLESDMLKAIELSHGLFEKRKKLDKDNARRAIGLWLWDHIYLSDLEFESKQSLVELTVKKLEKENSELLGYYRSGYRNVANSKGGYSAYKTVVTEMLRDLKLADTCIRELDFFTSNQIKTGKA